ncbi:3-keto-disaccharide hydrolase [Thalassotalea hakodatensis]|uniref:3-keto-disaccharide hydrolase n=1 Tax=Thalassotalea hakodatensis TaxID=3030492 RepID=UPI00257309EE|nr:DUF1080 domain-containing protein [Thalassotalea hakodatensis]
MTKIRGMHQVTHNFKAVLITTACLLFSSSAMAETNNQLTDAEKQAGWQLLFDGKQASQWRNYQQKTLSEQWQVIDDTLTLTGKGGGDIITQTPYENFELKLDWRISEAGNSGIFIRVDEKGKYVYSRAPEIQILDNLKHSDRKDPTHRSGSLYDMIASPDSSHKLAGEWNSVRIRVNEGHLEVWQNQVKTTDIVMGSDRWNGLVANSKFATWQGFGEQENGYIGLQDHGDVVSFRNIKIKEL